MDLEAVPFVARTSLAGLPSGLAAIGQLRTM